MRGRESHGERTPRTRRLPDVTYKRWKHLSLKEAISSSMIDGYTNYPADSTAENILSRPVSAN